MDISRFINFRNKPFLLSSVLLLTFLGVVIQLIGHNIKGPDFILSNPSSVVDLAFVLYMVSLYLIVLNIFAFLRRKYLESRYRKYIFSRNHWPKEWIFSGSPENLNKKDLFIKWTRAGCLLKNHNWKNFRMSCEIKFLDQSKYDQTIGLIFRAEDLDNYFMLELSKKHNNIKPHVRYHGGWDILEESEQRYLEEEFIPISLEVINEEVNFYMSGNLKYTWTLPTHADVYYWESGVPKQKSKDNKQDDSGNTRDKQFPNLGHVQKIHFRETFGMVGFRAHPGQGVIVRDLQIESI